MFATYTHSGFGPRGQNAFQNGMFKPVAKTFICSGLPSAVIPRKTLMSPALVSARNISPLGARRITRGLVNPVAYNSTLKPGGAFGQVVCGRGTIFGPFVAELVA